MEIFMGEARRRRALGCKHLEQLTEFVTVAIAAQKCYQHFGRGVMVYLPKSVPIYAVLPRLLNGSDQFLLDSYNPEKEFVLSHPFADFESPKRLDPKDYIDMIFHTSICKNEDKKGLLKIGFSSAIDLDSPAHLKMAFSIDTE
jgi:hypothetical protein